MKRVLGWFGAAVVALLTSCNPYNYNPYYYDYAYYDPYYYSYDTDYLYGAYDPYGVYYFASDPTGEGPFAMDLNEAARQIAAHASSYFSPASCVIATADEAVVTYEFDGCTGGFSGRRIDGKLNVTVSLAGDQIIFTASDASITIDGIPYNAAFKAAASAAGNQRVITIDSTGYAPSQTASRRSSGTIVWNQGDPCITVDAQGSSGFQDITVTSSISRLARCAASCPSGGIVVVSGPDGAFTANFGGGADLRVIGPQGNDRTFNLQCL